MKIDAGLVANPGAAPSNESMRLAALARYSPDSLVDDPELTRITQFASHLCDTPIALVSLVEEERQRFLARDGLDASETPRSMSFCAHAMFEKQVMVIPDASRDERFADNALVTGEPYIRFYAGAPLVSDDGYPLGSLCVIAPVARAELTPLQKEGLMVLADAVMRRLRDRKREIAASWGDKQELFRILADSMPQIVWSTLPDGYHDYYNARWYEFTGVPLNSTDGEGWNGMFHPDDQERAWARWRHSLETGEPYEIEYRLRRADGEYRWTLGRALPMRDANGQIIRWFGTCTDIHEQKSLLESRDLLSRELGHRIKNIFSLVSGVIGLMGRARPELQQFGAEIQERLVALAKAHDLVNPMSRAKHPTLRSLLAELFEPWNADGEERICVGGGDAEISSRSATPLALLFHELATNASKYGALSADSGRVQLTLENSGEELIIHWRETGGPAVSAPDGGGFGSELVTASVERQLRGTIAHDWKVDGLDIRMAIPRDRLAD